MSVKFQVAWSTATPGQTHVTFAGHRTPCGDGLPVIEAETYNASRLRDVSCVVCGAFVHFDMEAATRAAQTYVNEQPSTSTWDPTTRISFATKVAEQVGGVAFRLYRKHGEWNTNGAFSDFMAGGGWMTDKSPEARLIGGTAQAVLAALVPNEQPSS